MRRLSLACGLIILAACDRDPARPRISFSDVETPAKGAARPVKPVRIAIASIVSPQKNLQDYERMLQYLGRKLGAPVEVVQRAGYSEAISLLENREVDVAFICSGPYVDARARFGAEALVVPQIGGKRDYRAYIIVRKPCDLSELCLVIDRTFAESQLRRENEVLQRRVSRESQFDLFVGADPGVQEALRMAQKAAGASSAVLISGETGTGKEIVARMIHQKSARRDESFLALNGWCGFVPTSKKRTRAR